MSALRMLARRFIPRGARNWLRSPKHTLAWARDEMRHRMGLDRRVTMRPGWSLLCHPAAYRLAYHVHHDDPPQVAELDGFIATCSPGMLLFDLGAHFGLFSFAALHYGNPGARAVAVEPSPEACRMLGIQATLNGRHDALTIVQAAAADQSAVRPMLPIGVIAAGYWSGAIDGYSARDLTLVRTVTLDELAEQWAAHPTHIKIDVEGFEAEVLRGGARVLARRPGPLLFLELHTAMIRERGGDPAEAPAMLEELGYRFFDAAGTPRARADLTRSGLMRVVARRG